MISMSLRSFKIQSYYILGILLLGWMLTPFSAHFLGAGIGLIVSMYCVWLLGRRIEKLGDSIVKKTKAPTLGMFNRFVPPFWVLLLCTKLSTTWLCGRLQ